MAYEIKKDALLPSFRVQLKSTDPVTKTLVPHNLTTITGGFFYMRTSPTATAKVHDGVMSVVGDPLEGWIEYFWEVGDTNTVGLYLVEVKLMYGTKPMKFPSKGYFQVEITDDLET